MDKIKNYIIYSLIILILCGLCILFGYLYYIEKNKPANQIFSTITEVQIDTIQFTDSLFYPVPVIIEKPVFDSIIDTVYVINDYYTGKIYEYNFKDTNIKFHAGIMIHKNALVSFIPEYEIYQKSTTITNNIVNNQMPDLMIIAGGGIDSYNSKFGLMFTTGVIIKNNVIDVFYDPILKSYGISYKYVIKIK